MSEGVTGSKVELYDLNRPEIEALLSELGEPAYRGHQLGEWLYVHLATDFTEMTNLPRGLRQALADRTSITTLQVMSSICSSDGETRKDSLRLRDHNAIETVLMRYQRRRTACISTQAGCPIGCPFCATGQMGLHRNLSSGEIIAQALHFARILRTTHERLTNVVMMGMGEPLLNYDASLAAIRRLVDSEGFGLGQRRISLSTAGVVPGIRRLAGEGLEITLAVSLHAATDALRNRLVPLNRRYPLDELFEACHYYVMRTHRRVSFEWALIEGENDTPEQVSALVARLAGLQAHVNLIPFNAVAGYRGRASSPHRLAAFASQLERRGVRHTIRTRRGVDIGAGCGQLVCCQTPAPAGSRD